MITLPPNFESDIQGQNLNLYPIVIIGTYTGLDDDDFTNAGTMIINGHIMHFSTKSVSLPYNINNSVPSVAFKPLLLNIPSIKESMDFENRNYKISNVTLKISNFEYEGERFSDYAGNLINKEVRIYWVSQSTIGWAIYPQTENGFALQVYKGFIRRYSHDDESVTLSLEDSTQKDLHKDVPVARLGDGDAVPDRYKLKPIPMVYGHVVKSPCVFQSNMLEGFSELNIFADNIAVQGFETGYYWHGKDLYGLWCDALWVYRSDNYFNVKRSYRTVDPELTFTADNYSTNAGTATIIIEPKYDSNGNGINAPGNDLIDVNLIRIPQTVTILENENYETHDISPLGNLITHTMDSADFSHEGYLDAYTLTIKPRWSSVPEDDVWYIKTYSLHNIIANLISSDYEEGSISFRVVFDYNFEEWGIVYYNIPGDNELNEGQIVKSNNMHAIAYTDGTYNENLVSDAFELYDVDGGTYWSYYSFYPAEYLKYEYKTSGTFSVNTELEVKGIGIYHKILFDKYEKGDFYANIKGRTLAAYEL